MNSIPVEYYVGDASRKFNEFVDFCNEHFHYDDLKAVEQLCLNCDLDEQRWNYLQQHYRFSSKVLLAKPECIPWSRIYIEYERFTDRMVDRLEKWIEMDKVAMYSTRVTEECLSRYADRIDFGLLPHSRRCFSDDFIDRYRDRLNWTVMVEKKLIRCGGRLTDAFLDRFSDCFTTEAWKTVSKYGNLTSDQLEKYKDRLDWRLLTLYHLWDAGKVRRFMDRIDWAMLESLEGLNARLMKLAKMRTEAFG